MYVYTHLRSVYIALQSKLRINGTMISVYYYTLAYYVCIVYKWCVFSVHIVHHQYRGTGHVHSDVMWLAHYQRVLPARQCLWLQRLCKSRSEHRRP